MKQVLLGVLLVPAGLVLLVVSLAGWLDEFAARESTLAEALVRLRGMTGRVAVTDLAFHCDLEWMVGGASGRSVALATTGDDRILAVFLDPATFCVDLQGPVFGTLSAKRDSLAFIGQKLSETDRAEAVEAWRARTGTLEVVPAVLDMERNSPGMLAWALALLISGAWLLSREFRAWRFFRRLRRSKNPAQQDFGFTGRVVLPPGPYVIRASALRRVRRRIGRAAAGALAVSAAAGVFVFDGVRAIANERRLWETGEPSVEGFVRGGYVTYKSVFTTADLGVAHSPDGDSFYARPLSYLALFPFPSAVDEVTARYVADDPQVFVTSVDLRSHLGRGSLLALVALFPLAAWILVVRIARRSPVPNWRRIAAAPEVRILDLVDVQPQRTRGQKTGRVRYRFHSPNRELLIEHEAAPSERFTWLRDVKPRVVMVVEGKNPSNYVILGPALAPFEFSAEAREAIARETTTEYPSWGSGDAMAALV